MSTDRASFVARITEGLEQRKLAEKCHYVGNPYCEYVREADPQAQTAEKEVLQMSILPIILVFENVE